MRDESAHAAAVIVMIASVVAVAVSGGNIRGAGIVAFLLSLYPVARSEMPASLRGGLVAVAVAIAGLWYVGNFTVRAYAVVSGFAVLLLGALVNDDLRPGEGAASEGPFDVDF